jgi:hypothetical protein
MTIEFNRGAIRPVACLKEGYALIKGQFWLFLGIVFVGIMIGAAVPFGVLMGPMMCGIDYAFFRRMRGEQAEFGDLFKGFDYFKPAAIASLIQTAPILVISIIGVVIIYVPFLTLMVAQSQERPNQPPDPAIVWGFMGALGVFVFVIMIVAVLLQLIFLFAFPLIVEHKLAALDAIKLSARAGFANLGGMIGLLLLGMALSFAGVLACYVGAFLVMPILYASHTIAYRQVFSAAQVAPVNTAPPPPPNW